MKCFADGVIRNRHPAIDRGQFGPFFESDFENRPEPKCSRQQATDIAYACGRFHNAR